MKLRVVLAAMFVIGMSAVCVRLGIWQLSRLGEKRAQNATLRAALAAPPIAIEDPGAAGRTVIGRRVTLTGIYDERHQILLAGHSNNGSPGVQIVTPLIVGETAVLVNRGWLHSADGTTAHPERYPESGVRVVVGIAEPLLGGRAGPPMAIVRSDSATLWSAKWLDVDSLAGRIPHAIAAFGVRQLPGDSLGEYPLRSAPKPLDEMTHVSYAIQWFSFATILSVGSLFVAIRRRNQSNAPGVPAR